MRDRLVSNEKYFKNFIKYIKSIVLTSEKSMEQQSIPIERYYIANSNIFMHNLQILVAQYSKGEDFATLENQCTKCIMQLSTGWERVIKSSDDVAPFFASRRFFQDLMDDFRYKAEGLLSTNPIAKNFKAIDNYKPKSGSSVGGAVVQADLVVSMKTTTVTSVSDWLKSPAVVKILDSYSLVVDKEV